MALSLEAPPETVDVVVIGAGPGGATTAARLAQSGHSVLLLERRTHPRFHIGESLLPPCNAIFEKLGVLERIKEQGYVVKYGAEFSGGKRGDKHGRIPFSEQGEGRHPTTFQTERAHFDRILSEFAQECGAHFIQEAVVQELLHENGRVVGVRYDHGGGSHTVRSRFVIDAGGRASKVAQTFGLRRYPESLRMVALYRHFTDMDERYNPGVEGDIQIGGHKDGWVWAIPIWSDTISVGAVMPRDVLRNSGRDREAVFNDHVSRIGRIEQRITGTRPHTPLHVEADYCYYSDTMAGPGWFMVGDAACFFDPIFSGGVFLAMTTAIRAADTTHAILAEPEREEQLQLDYTNFYKTGYDIYARLIHAYYEYDYNLRPFLQSVGMDLAGDGLATNKWLVRLVSGDFWSDKNALNLELRKESRWDTFAPFEPVWGCPFYEHLNQAEEPMVLS
ncbi:NAD(P)/FAD-dependent oxidoreductase [Salinactinospora qingdaonensis]|uniref:NAD(P)/FAD-dependent oxidoreductase n=1 Tax=Salinactinospora qingdaonensis TaxID=702744 RepID=A0ABP7FWA1_9ACTN